MRCPLPHPSALETVAELVGQSYEQLRRGQVAAQAASGSRAVCQVLTALAGATDERSAVQSVLRRSAASSVQQIQEIQIDLAAVLEEQATIAREFSAG